MSSGRLLPLGWRGHARPCAYATHDCLCCRGILHTSSLHGDQSRVSCPHDKTLNPSACCADWRALRTTEGACGVSVGIRVVDASSICQNVVPNSQTARRSCGRMWRSMRRCAAPTRPSSPASRPRCVSIPGHDTVSACLVGPRNPEHSWAVGAAPAVCGVLGQCHGTDVTDATSRTDGPCGGHKTESRLLPLIYLCRAASCCSDI